VGVRGPRRATRHLNPLCIKALLYAGAEPRFIEIKHYTRDGLTFNCARCIDPGKRVTIELLSGQRLPVRVVWVKDGEVDVRFLSPLASGHTVMRWLREAARRHATSVGAGVLAPDAGFSNNSGELP
jgi:hypothetical protein